jgi:hypothetical protein
MALCGISAGEGRIILTREVPPLPLPLMGTKPRFGAVPELSKRPSCGPKEGLPWARNLLSASAGGGRGAERGDC